jgi:hypothetical protein
VPLAEFVDSAGELAIGFPSDWRQLTEDEILDQLGIADDGGGEAALANIVAVVVSPDRRALVSITRVPRLAEGRSLDEVVAAVQSANAASVPGATDVEAEPIELDGVDAVRLTFAAADPATGEAEARSIRQVVSTFDGDVIVLTFVVPTDAAVDFEDDFRRIEESVRWRS